MDWLVPTRSVQWGAHHSQCRSCTWRFLKDISVHPIVMQQKKKKSSLVHEQPLLLLLCIGKELLQLTSWWDWAISVPYGISDCWARRLCARPWCNNDLQILSKVTRRAFPCAKEKSINNYQHKDNQKLNQNWTSREKEKFDVSKKQKLDFMSLWSHLIRYAINNKEKENTLSSIERSCPKNRESYKSIPQVCKNPLGPMNMTPHHSTCTTLMKKVSIFSYDLTY